MSTLDRFRNRKNRPQVITVPYPLGDNPIIEFTVKRIPMAVRNNANIDTRGTLKRAAIEAPDTPEDQEDEAWKLYTRELNSWHGYHLVEQARDHFTAWKPLDGSDLPTFSKAAFVDFVGELSIPEKQMLGLSYMISEQKADQEHDDAKKEHTGEGS